MAGIVAGFAGAVTAGYQAAAYLKPSSFLRFHNRLSPQGAFYPPFAMLRNLALARAKPGVTVVIIGGNSILYGAGQAPSDLWSLHLQELLGPRYAVLNLAFVGAYPSEAGALAAEVLLRRNLPVIYLANTAPGPEARPYESLYRYLFWDAYWNGELMANPPRDAEIARRLQVLPRASRALFEADRLAGRVDALFHTQELWHHVAYRHASTLWNFLARDEPWAPRDRLPDLEPPERPLAQRFRDNPAVEMDIVRGFSESFAETDGRGGWQLTRPSELQAVLDIDEIFTPPLRRRMLMLLVENCPYYRDQLTPAERERDRFVFEGYAQLWRDQGVACRAVGADFTAADYDRAHLSIRGGRKLAALMAEEIRRFPAP